MFVMMNNRSMTRLAAVLALVICGVTGCAESVTYEKAPDANKAAQEQVNESLKNSANRNAKAQGAIPKSVKGRAAAAPPAAP